MIRHVVFFRAKHEKYLEAIYDGLMLLQDNPHATYFEVGRNLRADTLSASPVDFIVYAEFASQAELESYKKHALYQASIDAVRPLRDTRIAADFLSGSLVKAQKAENSQ